MGKVDTVVENQDWAYMLGLDASDELGFTYSTTGSGLATFSAVSSGLSLVVDRWTWVGAVFRSGTPEVQFYQDGLPLGSAVSIGGTGTVRVNAAAFTICGLDGGGDDGYRGYIDQVRVFDDERTDSEMFDDYLSDVASATNLQIGLGLDNDFTDVSGNANTLTNSSLTFIEGEVHGFQGGTSLVPVDGGASGGNLNYFEAQVVNESGAVGGGGSLVYRMRGNDTTLTSIVYWGSTEVDSDASEYGGPGPVTDIVVHKVLGT